MSLKTLLQAAGNAFAVAVQKMRIRSLGIFLTRRCNFRCAYCCSLTGTDPPDKMTFDDMTGAVLQARALGARQIVIAGEGEPFLDNDLFPLVDYGLAHGLQTTVFTNGSLIDQHCASHLFTRKVAVALKLHALDQTVYDFLAGKKNASKWTDYRLGTCENQIVRIPQGLKNLLEAGYGRKPATPFSKSLLEIEAVVVKQNLDQIRNVARLCRKLDLDFMVESLIKTNRANRELPTLAVTAEDESRLFFDLCKILGPKFRWRQNTRCRFESNPFLDVSGNIRHCFSLPADIGNIRTVSLAELHQKELHLRKQVGMMSKRFDFRHRGFRQCASRKAIGDNWSF